MCPLMMGIWLPVALSSGCGFNKHCWDLSDNWWCCVCHRSWICKAKGGRSITHFTGILEHLLLSVKCLQLDNPVKLIHINAGTKCSDVSTNHAFKCVFRFTIHVSELSPCSSRPSVKLLPSRGREEPAEHVQGNVSASTQRRPTKQRCRQVTVRKASRHL